MQATQDEPRQDEAVSSDDRGRLRNVLFVAVIVPLAWACLWIPFEARTYIWPLREASIMAVQLREDWTAIDTSGRYGVYALVAYAVGEETYSIERELFSTNVRAEAQRAMLRFRAGGTVWVRCLETDPRDARIHQSPPKAFFLWPVFVVVLLACALSLYRGLTE